MEFREILESKKLDEAALTSKDVENPKLSDKTKKLATEIINHTENDVNTYLKWIIFDKDSKKSDKDIKNYIRIFSEFANKINALNKELQNDYK